MIQVILPVLQLILAFCNICIMGYVFVRFVGKPHTTLEARVAVLENDMKEVKHALRQGNNRFQEQDTTNEILIRSLLALIEFEIQYCLTENKPISDDLRRAKDDLHNFLSKR